MSICAKKLSVLTLLTLFAPACGAPPVEPPEETGLVEDQEPRVVSLRINACHALVGEATHAPDDFSRVSCARAVRLRLLSPDASEVLSEQCVELEPIGRTLEDVLRPAPGQPGIFSLDARPGPLVAELQVLRGCAPGDQLLGAGRSSVVDPASGLQLTVPLGMRSLCQRTGEIGLLPFNMIENIGFTAPPSFVPGDLFAFDSLTSTNGECVPPSTTTLAGAFRPFPFTREGEVLRGDFGFDALESAGCLALRSEVAGGEGFTYSCLDPSQNNPRYVPMIEDERWRRIVRQTPPGARNGALLIRVMRGSERVAGARIFFDRTGREAVYPVDRNLSAFSNEGTVEGVGLALLFDAPAGRYRVSGAGEERLTFIRTGAGDEPRSVTLYTILR